MMKLDFIQLLGFILSTMEAKCIKESNVSERRRDYLTRGEIERRNIINPETILYENFFENNI